MYSAKALTSDDRCRRKAILDKSWERKSIHPTSILHRGIEAGLQSDVIDPGQFASDTVMQLCVSRPIETDSFDLIGIAEHTAALACFICWTVRGDNPAWEHPEDVMVGEHTWESSAYLSGTRLRRLIVVDRWPELGDQAILNSWDVQGEAAIYGLPIDLLICVVGQRRDERWHSPWTKGFLHAINNQLRFRKRDGEPFVDSWQKIWREHFKGDRQDWLDALTDDGLLPEMLVVHSVPVPEHADEICKLAEKRLRRIQCCTELPEPQLSNCWNPISPCQFRSCCPYWRLPSESSGFLRLGKI